MSNETVKVKVSLTKTLSGAFKQRLGSNYRTGVQILSLVCQREWKRFPTPRQSFCSSRLTVKWWTHHWNNWPKVFGDNARALHDNCQPFDIIFGINQIVVILFTHLEERSVSGERKNLHRLDPWRRIEVYSSTSMSPNPRFLVENKCDYW